MGLAASSALVLSVGVNFLEDVEIEAISLGPLWSKTSPMFCMRIAAFPTAPRLALLGAASMVGASSVPLKGALRVNSSIPRSGLNQLLTPPISQISVDAL